MPHLQPIFSLDCMSKGECSHSAANLVNLCRKEPAAKHKYALAYYFFQGVFFSSSFLLTNEWLELEILAKPCFYSTQKSVLRENSIPYTKTGRAVVRFILLEQQNIDSVRNAG